MRLSYVIVVIAASFLVTTEALSTNTGVQAANLVGPAQRLLRKHYTAAENDDDSEARALNTEKMKTMLKAGMTVDDYAAKLKLTDKIAAAANSARAMEKLGETLKMKKLLRYLNYVAEHTAV
ncbi:PexRD2 family secreted RxLR effector peptide, putative [Phytophthora infestans T30-4]|uniref:PexRD2 family secreted RxLR effector peptide, putative n=1 Tax=Phytophthora infestans (strain T30-4) TaxID=403677 RepID=D0NIN6_PHYIT|nr:PexRD2 family secreted RxLR effector peptide, putative [Phytophthora infestans T30-4]EEY59370.1 PexRD2 family secreted RxLR effector peptide, putative [Phytophthora infestans T30-4]|eukprot:XP_002900980.1 PexRD2 family secreted RxLR effector peptide, putative [Phytophthora infestans T30-4]